MAPDADLAEQHQDLERDEVDEPANREIDEPRAGARHEPGDAKIDAAAFGRLDRAHRVETHGQRVDPQRTTLLHLRAGGVEQVLNCA